MNRNEKNSELFEENKPCAYREDTLSDIRYKYIPHCDDTTHYSMIERGWRRFGYVHFAPECKNCFECKTIRIDVENFKFTSSHKRILNKNKDLKIYIQKPTLSIDHLNLFNKYHQYMHEKKDWPHNNITPQDYQSSYVDGAHNYGKEILYFLDDTLICVALSDVLENGISAVYCYYDHKYQERSLGKFSILIQMSLAKLSKIPYM
ncbi:MAG: arginyltransferase, partial [Arcobacteraceae bacterium]|nr:arginyltransferase [Arcobacteraceae bacterium]